MPSKAAIKKLKAIRQDAEVELFFRIKQAQISLAGKIRAAAANPSVVKSKKYRDQFFNTYKGQYEALATNLDEWGQELVDTTAVQWHAEAISDARALGTPVKASVLKFSRRRVQQYWELINPDNSTALLATYTNKMAAADIGHLRTAFVETYRQRVLEGWSHNEFHKRLQAAWDEAAGNLSGERFVDAAGRKWKNAAYLSMLVRTTANRVARDSYIDTMQAGGDDLARITPSGASCPICNRWIGVIVSTSGADPKFPSYNDALAAGMFHPNCDCYLSRMDPTVHAADIERQEETENVDWQDDEALEKYKADFEKTPAAPAKATLEDVRARARQAGIKVKRTTPTARPKPPPEPPPQPTPRPAPTPRPRPTPAAPKPKAAPKPRAKPKPKAKPAPPKPPARIKVTTPKEELEALRKKNTELAQTLRAKKARVASLKEELAKTERLRWEPVKDATDRESYAQQFRALGMEPPVISRDVPAAQRVKMLNRMGFDQLRMAKKYPKVVQASVEHHKPLHTLLLNENHTRRIVVKGGQDKIAKGSWLTADVDGQPLDIITVATKGHSWKRPLTRVGRFTTTNNVQGTFRHEYGHRLYNIAKEGRKSVVKGMDTEWRSLFGKMGGVNSDTLKKGISEYGASNAQEGFSEAFSAWVDPKYRVAKTKMPTEIEAFMRKWIGG